VSTNIILGELCIRNKSNLPFDNINLPFPILLGMMVARYFKQTWTGAQCCSKDMWFVIHRLMMVLTWLLTLAGFFLIFFELGWEWIGNRKESTGNPHHILGCVTTGLCFIQPFMALLRPDPDSRK
jgi:hypothetical protein